MPRSCPKGYIKVKAHSRDGKKVKSSCRKVSSKGKKGSAKRRGSSKGKKGSVKRRGSSKGKKSSSKKRKALKCKKGQVKVKSHRHGSKRVKPYCRNLGQKRVVGEVEIDEVVVDEMESPECSTYMDKASCNEVMDKNNLRRCRYNFMSKSCEYLPTELRQRATLGVGGSATYEGYKPGQIGKIAIPDFKQPEKQQRQVGKLSDVQLRKLREQLGAQTEEDKKDILGLGYFGMQRIR